MTRSALLALACLAGCATHDPQPIIDNGRLYEFSTGLTPHRLARLRRGCDAMQTARVLVPAREIVPVERRPAPAPVAPEHVLRGRPRG